MHLLQAIKCAFFEIPKALDLSAVKNINIAKGKPDPGIDCFDQLCIFCIFFIFCKFFRFCIFQKLYYESFTLTLIRS